MAAHFATFIPPNSAPSAARAALERATVAPEPVDEVVIGHARQAGSGPNPARQVGRRAGLPDPCRHRRSTRRAPRACRPSRLRRTAILLGESEVVLAGGIESMSRMPYLIDAEDARWGHKMGNFPLVDAMYRDGFRCSLCGMIMGETAELLAREYGITREESDAFALESQRRAEAAIARRTLPRRDRAGDGSRRKGDSDGRRRRRASAAGHDVEALRKLPPVFPTSTGTPASSPPGHRRASPTAAPRWSWRAPKPCASWSAAAGAHRRLGERRRRSADAWASGPCRR